MNKGLSIRTHAAIDGRLVGTPVALGEGSATVLLQATPEMSADDRGLVHGGFLFGLADYAAMLAVNEPTVVLASGECRFVSPVVVGDRIQATAERLSVEGRKQRVRVVVRRGEVVVCEGTFLCVVPVHHVLERGPAADGEGAR